VKGAAEKNTKNQQKIALFSLFGREGEQRKKDRKYKKAEK